MPELFQAVVIGMLADDELFVGVVSWNPTCIHIVRGSNDRLECDPGHVHGHVVHAVVVEVVGGVDGRQVLV